MTALLLLLLVVVAIVLVNGAPRLAHSQRLLVGMTLVRNASATGACELRKLFANKALFVHLINHFQASFL